MRRAMDVHIVSTYPQKPFEILKTIYIPETQIEKTMTRPQNRPHQLNVHSSNRSPHVPSPVVQSLALLHLDVPLH